jgi:hypothetical protein
MNSKTKALSPHTSRHDNSSNTGGGPSSLIKANHTLVGQMDIYEVLAAIAAEEGGA